VGGGGGGSLILKVETRESIGNRPKLTIRSVGQVPIEKKSVKGQNNDLSLKCGSKAQESKKLRALENRQRKAGEYGVLVEQHK